MRISEQIARSLEKAILKGEFPTGSRFPSERELAERFQASRSSIREAVGKLAQLGLVETLPQSGTYVSNYLIDGSMDLLVHLMKHGETVDSDVVLSLMEFRRMTEAFAVRRAVLNAKEEDIRDLTRIVERECRPGIRAREMADCDYTLHTAIIRFASNLVLQLLFNSFKPVYRFYADLFFRLPDTISTTVAQHKKLVRAFSKRDPEAAASFLEEALSYGEKRVVEALRKQAGGKPRKLNHPFKARGSF